MNIDEAIELAKLQEQERVPMSLKVPVSVKKKLQDIADENSISLNILVSSILDNFLNGTVSTNAYKLYEEFKDVSNKISDFTTLNNQGIPLKGFSVVPDAIDDDYTSMLIDRYYVLKSILGVKE